MLAENDGMLPSLSWRLASRAFSAVRLGSVFSYLAGQRDYYVFRFAQGELTRLISG